jgi:hypothetical protein
VISPTGCEVSSPLPTAKPRRNRSDISEASSTSLPGRVALPYGAVMATGLASELAPVAHLSSLRLLLLGVAVLLAVALAVLASICWFKSRQDLGAPAVVAQCLGRLTVPIGLDVIASGLFKVGGRPARDAATASVCIAWIVTAALAVGVGRLAAERRWRGPVEGVWFLGPACLLADAIGAANIAGHFQLHELVGSVATAMLALGGVGYLVVLVMATTNLVSSRVLIGPRSSWWIGAGCGGLGASATGSVGAAVDLSGTGALGRGFEWTAFGFWAAATIVLIPILGAGLSYAARHMHPIRHRDGTLPWTPTFSTGVYALGTAVVARQFNVPVLTSVTSAAAIGTIGLWVFTVLEHLAGTRALLPARTPPGQ